MYLSISSLIVTFEEFEYTKGVIRIRKSKKNRKHNSNMNKRTKNDLQIAAHKTKDRATRILIHYHMNTLYKSKIFHHFVKNIAIYRSENLLQVMWKSYFVKFM